MRYIYGPVNSRRLGLSLGISLTPYKVCSFDCLYCQLGRTTQKTNQREVYLKTEEILEELQTWLKHNASEAEKLNYLTFSGSGEPTLNIKIGELIAEIKKITAIPVAVITNASLLSEPQVRQAVSQANLIVPSLDAASPEMLAKINRPHQEIKIDNIINGLISLRKEFKGKLWLEVMLVKGVNDDLRQIKKLKEIVEKINPDKVHLNSPVRTPAGSGILAVEKSKLEKIKEILGERCEII